MVHFVSLGLERCDFLDNITVAVHDVTNFETEKIFAPETGGDAENKEEIIAERVLVVVVFDELENISPSRLSGEKSCGMLGIIIAIRISPLAQCF